MVTTLLAVLPSLLPMVQADDPAVGPAGPLLAPAYEPVSFERVALEDGFWQERLAVVEEVTVPLVLERCFETGRVENLRIAGGLAEGEFVGRLYDDSDVYKALEGVARVLHLDPDSDASARLKARATEVIDAIEAAQCDDGYISSYYQLVHGARDDAAQRWTNVAHGHELYCIGHLIEAGIAWQRATGEARLLDVGVRAADHVASVFLGEGARTEAPGHQELELALFELSEATGEQRFGLLARDLLERRGRTRWNGAARPSFGEYCQDHAPIRELDAPVGHAVRLMYQLCAMTDLVRLDGDPALLAALERTWESIADGHLYAHGGIGASASNEGFSTPHVLPNDTAYAETCAAIGMVLWNHRMGLLTGERRYFELAERALCNNVLAGISLDGERFFYVNPLASRGGHHRVPWFDCSCCPTNLARVLPSVGGLVFATEGAGAADPVLAVVQPFAASTTLDVGGVAVTVTQTGGLFGAPLGRPRVLEVACDAPVDLTLRVRTSAGPGTLVVPALPAEVAAGADGFAKQQVAPRDGWLDVRRTWRGGERLELDRGLDVTVLPPDPRVEAQRGRVAVFVGPFLYAAEAVDNGGHAANLVVQAGRIGAHALALGTDAHVPAAILPRLVLVQSSRRLDASTFDEADVLLAPYFAWDNREAGELAVWLPTTRGLAAVPGESPLIARTDAGGGMTLTASHCFHSDSVASLLDDREPRASADHSLPRHTFWDHRGTEEWLQIDFTEPRTVGAAECYWFDDTGTGSCRVPERWTVEWRDGDAWREVHAAALPDVALDRWNALAFDPVTTGALRVRVKLQAGWSGGFLGLRVAEGE